MSADLLSPLSPLTELEPMTSAADPRREVAARVQTKPHFLTSEAQAHRYFGTAAKKDTCPRHCPGGGDVPLRRPSAHKR
jgi:hypothetical protein